MRWRRFLRDALLGFWQYAKTDEGVIYVGFFLALVVAFLVMTVGGGLVELQRRLGG